jgi:gliding motility-associated protein GldM
MSIPREPRQLMINVMYIVLTALLALNVSAEVFNAFDMVYEGLNKSSAALDQQNTAIPEQIKARAKAKPEFAKYAERVPTVNQYGKELTTYIDEMMLYLIDQNGDKDGTISDGDYIFIDGVKTKKFKGERNFDIVTNYLINQKKGQELHDKILEYREKFLSLIDEKDRPTFDIGLSIDDETWKKSTMRRNDWADFTFSHMPLTATLPIFAKFKNDAKSTQVAVLNYLLSKVGGEDVVLDRFTVMSSPKRSYVIKGETFETEVFLSASASSASNTGVSISINGARVPVDQNGVAVWKASATTLGRRPYSATVSVSNPVTGKTETYKREFEFEVGERAVTVSATKMNVFYIGVDNPVEVAASGISSNDLKVTMGGSGGGTISKNANGTFTVNVKTPTRPGDFANVVVSAPGVNYSSPFRVKPIPTPIAKLGDILGGQISQGVFKAQKGLIPSLEGFDFDAKCQIEGYRVVRVPRREDPRPAVNAGGGYKADAQAVVNQATPGDRYFFENVKCKCPGWPAAKDINNLTFLIQ